MKQNVNSTIQQFVNDCCIILSPSSYLLYYSVPYLLFTVPTGNSKYQPHQHIEIVMVSAPHQMEQTLYLQYIVYPDSVVKNLSGFAYVRKMNSESD